MNKWIFLGLCLLAGAGCARVNAPQHDDYQRLAGNIAQWGAIVDLRSGAQVEAAQLLDTLAAADTVLVGELHDNPAHHLIEQWLATGLRERRPQGAVVLEMLDSGQQRSVSEVQAWLRQGNQLRRKRLGQVMQWNANWDWTQYGALVESLMQGSAPLLAGNLSATERRALMAVPPPSAEALFPSQGVADRQRRQIVEMHCGQVEQPRLDATLAVQHARDQRMANVLDRAASPRLLFAGTLHALKGLGVPQYLKNGPADPGLKVLVLGEQGQTVSAADADYLWLLPTEDAAGAPLGGRVVACDPAMAH
ncbi:ChaN family lipoprotein [Pseudomonas sp. X10]